MLDIFDESDWAKEMYWHFSDLGLAPCTSIYAATACFLYFTNCTMAIVMIDGSNVCIMYLLQFCRAILLILLSLRNGWSDINGLPRLIYNSDQWQPGWRTMSMHVCPYKWPRIHICPVICRNSAWPMIYWLGICIVASGMRGGECGECVVRAVWCVSVCEVYSECGACVGRVVLVHKHVTLVYSYTYIDIPQGP